MAKLNPESAWEFADAIKSIVKPQTTRRKATVQSVDKDGTIWVNLPGSSTVTPIQSTGANVSPGDTVLTELRGTSLHITENQTNPAIGESTARSIARQETQHAEAMAKQAQTIADEAQAVAEATNQHFFADDNGAHITDVTQDEWTAAVEDEFSDYDPDTKPYHNQLLNSLGILLRTALNNLVSITRSAIAFYDGQGNNASNIVARFGSTGAQIGKSSAAHSVIDADGQRFYGSNGTEQLANIGYGEGTSGQGITDVAPYYTFGRRQHCIAYSPNATYNEGDLCVYNGQHYCCTERGTTGSWDSSKWKILANTNTIGNLSTAEGASSSRGHCSHSEGNRTVADAESAHAEGRGARALGTGSHAEGYSTESSDSYSHSEGYRSIASGYSSHAQNTGTIASGGNQTAMGKYNVEDTSNDYALIIGNGTADDARSNALAVDWDGYLYPCNEKMPDFVVAQGTRGIWTYRKWHSGIMECWGTYTASIAVNASSSAYSSYRSGLITAPAYPFAFTAKPVATAIVSSGSSGAWVNNAQDSTATSFKFYLSAGGSLAAASRGVSIHAIGRWK